MQTMCFYTRPINQLVQIVYEVRDGLGIRATTYYWYELLVNIYPLSDEDCTQ